MKFALWSATLVCLFSAVLSLRAQKADINWTEFAFPDVGFKVSFPGVPKTTRKKALGENGPIDYLEASIGDKKTTFMATAADSPIVPDNSDTALKKHYDELRDGLIARSSAKLISERDIRVSGRIGREISAIFASQIGVIRYFVVDGTFIQLITMRHESLKDDPTALKNVEQFLSSFQFGTK